MTLLVVLVAISSASFLIYGILCLSSVSMVDDFARFGLERLRFVTGALEVLGGVGLLVGLRWQPALWLASGGLSLLMLIGFAVRIRMRDTLQETVPSFFFMLMNLFILLRSLRVV